MKLERHELPPFALTCKACSRSCLQRRAMAAKTPLSHVHARSACASARTQKYTQRKGRSQRPHRARFAVGSGVANVTPDARREKRHGACGSTAARRVRPLPLLSVHGAPRTSRKKCDRRGVSLVGGASYNQGGFNAQAMRDSRQQQRTDGGAYTTPSGAGTGSWRAPRVSMKAAQRPPSTHRPRGIRDIRRGRRRPRERGASGGRRDRPPSR